MKNLTLSEKIKVRDNVKHQKWNMDVGKQQEQHEFCFNFFILLFRTQKNFESLSNEIDLQYYIFFILYKR